MEKSQLRVARKIHYANGNFIAGGVNTHKNPEGDVLFLQIEGVTAHTTLLIRPDEAEAMIKCLKSALNLWDELLYPTSHEPVMNEDHSGYLQV